MSSQVGQRVQYTAVGGGNVENSTTTGEIIQIITQAEPAGSTGKTVKASEEEPRKDTAYKAENIIGVI
ncbi:hypothetical protein RSOLAG22IIIB_04515 [Rhizoctonia solani]|uniref:Hypervirulence associated protein TUDOR domain-containing protein n=1 Tax=Rhizoctonia solani TaxID=456999 RepID=A0A0K6FY68_9AGAM|nr:hypothetical protein RSOLAG22IIIB_04515 [Rhizoctonia solani]